MQVGNFATKYTEFIAAGVNHDHKKVEIVLDADALTILQAAMLLNEAAEKALDMLEPEMREEVIKTAKWAVGKDVTNS
ncbi:hypothetical protein D3C73_1456360 [compost metagenome]